MLQLGGRGLVRGGLAAVEGGEAAPQLVQLVGDGLVLGRDAGDVLLVQGLDLENGGHELLGGPAHQLLLGHDGGGEDGGRVAVAVAVVVRQRMRVVVMGVNGRRRACGGRLHAGGHGHAGTARGRAK
jgi:hypothetical protein